MNEKDIKELANCIALQAATVAEGTMIGSRTGRAKLILQNAERLVAWCELQDESVAA